MARVLIIDGNLAETRAQQIAAGGTDSGDAYAEIVSQLGTELGARIDCDIVRPADGIPTWTAGGQLANYGGAAITGSALNVYTGQAAVTRQVDLAKAVLAAAVPVFGSCWGLQVAVAATGGRVIENPLGREFGFARRIEVNHAGRAHAMFRDKTPVFEAITVHRDCVVELPPGGIELARNDMGLQAAEIRQGASVIWGVQYHPEYTLREIAATARRYGDALVKDGLFRDTSDLLDVSSALDALHAEPGNRMLAWRFGLGPGVLEPPQRRAEIRNWLAFLVLKRPRS
jgi:GMP synthase (glutamine-hydrolysing)